MRVGPIRDATWKRPDKPLQRIVYESTARRRQQLNRNGLRRLPGLICRP